MKFKNKNVLVYGYSVSGEWATKLLLKLKAKVFIYDDDLDKLATIHNCFRTQILNDEIIENLDIIIVSPSIEKDNIYLDIAKKHGVIILSELELASMFTPKNKLIAITGTNGKTTTTELVTKILKEKYKAVSCGNIGYPITRAYLEHKNDIKVVEVSSFMLENAKTFSPHVATILNVRPDHLIRHESMQEYTKLKLSIFKNFDFKDIAIVNLDENLAPTNTKNILTYSFSHIADCFVRGGYIYFHDEKVVAINELKIKGKHNIMNVMCAICFGVIYNVKLEKIKKALISFVPDDFRIQDLGTVGGLRFFNDSKSTNIASTLAAVDTVKGPIVLLLGGSKKALNYKDLFDKLSKRVKQVVVFGEISNDLVLANSNRFKIKQCPDLRSAFWSAVELSTKGDNVLLSPASASFDQFTSYIMRGNLFNDLVKEYEAVSKKE